MVQTLRFTSIQSPNMDHTCSALTRFLGKRLGIPTQFVGDIPWQDREKLLDKGEIHMGWLCGLPYVWKIDRDPACLELVAAPVMDSPRYRDRPIYYSDVIVRKKAPFKTFTDLEGAKWAYNEPASHSGYNLTRYMLAKKGHVGNFFGQIVEAGSHLRALEMVQNGEIGATAVDSTVLDVERSVRPVLSEELRVLESWGPSPMPPWVVRTELSPRLREAIRHVFHHIHESEEGRSILKAGLLRRMDPIEDHAYDLIREMETVASQIKW